MKIFRGVITFVLCMMLAVSFVACKQKGPQTEEATNQAVGAPGETAPPATTNEAITNTMQPQGGEAGPATNTMEKR